MFVIDLFYIVFKCLDHFCRSGFLNPASFSRTSHLNIFILFQPIYRYIHTYIHHTSHNIHNDLILINLYIMNTLFSEFLLHLGRIEQMAELKRVLLCHNVSFHPYSLFKSLSSSLSISPEDLFSFLSPSISHQHLLSIYDLIHTYDHDKDGQWNY